MVVEKQIIGNKNYDRISEIHVFDEAEGMDEETLGKALSKGQSDNKKDQGYGKMGRYGRVYTCLLFLNVEKLKFTHGKKIKF